MILLRKKSQIKCIIKEKHAYWTTENKGHYFLIPQFLMEFSEYSFSVDE